MKMMFTVIFLLPSVVFANPSQNKSSSELNWSTGEDKEYCIGGVCAKFEESKKPSMFDKVDKADRQSLKDPFEFREKNMEDNNHNTLTFSFGDQR